MSSPRTLFEKIWNEHVVYTSTGEAACLFIDLHLVHEVTSPQAFEGLKQAGRPVRRPDLTFATIDHNVPTTTVDRRNIKDLIAAQQINALRQNCQKHAIRLFDIGSAEQGIVHVIGPELGLTGPGMTIVCGDSHTSTHGAFGALAFGIGTSEVEHVLATQCLRADKPRTMQIRVNGKLPVGVTAKDLALGIIASIGTDGATGHVIEYSGDAVRSLSVEGRMTLCNMSIEAGARAGMVAPDDTTFAYLKDRPFAPKGQAWDEAVDYWKTLPTDDGAVFDRIVEIEAASMAPFVTWGTSPGMAVSIGSRIPTPAQLPSHIEPKSAERALEYMGLQPGIPIQDLPIDRVFIGSCTNARLDDLRIAATVARGHKVHPRVHAMVVPGSEAVKSAAEREHLDQIFRSAGFEWREPGCSMCLGMNPDILLPNERCASTSNRNFEGRQGTGGRTHLVSPAMAAAAAVAGHFVDVRDWDYKD